MRYKEIEPPAYFSKHVESYWEMTFLPGDSGNLNDFFLPDCTFNIIFTNEPLSIKEQSAATWKQIRPGATFFGQRSSYLSFLVKKTVRIFGIRFKPFAFANIIKVPIHLLNDQFFSLSKLFELSHKSQYDIAQIIHHQETEIQHELVNKFLADLFADSLGIDETVRAQTNYILDRKGLIKVHDLLAEFGTSKVTLRKHFLNKVGLTPKKVARIWRMNYLLQLKEDEPEANLTHLCLMCGFYDQAHFIREFKALLGSTPRAFFRQNSLLLKISQEGISRRFTNQYDPRI